MNVSGYLALFTLCLTKVDVSSATELEVRFDSKYVSEGRNNLNNGGIIWTTLSHDIDDRFTLIADHGIATASSEDYKELNLSLEFANRIGSFDYYMSYTHLEFEEQEDDNEIGLGGSWSGFEQITPSLDVTYSAESKGAFVETGIHTDIQLNDKISLSPYLKVAFDYGYAAENNHGYNHTAIGTELTFQINRSMYVGANIEHTIGGSFVKNELAENARLTWGGLRLHFDF